jgi:hypothetical protein
VFEALIDDHPRLRYDPDDGDGEPGSLWDFFKVGVWQCPKTGRRRLLSEDWWFCELAREAGYSVMMDERIVLKHVGTFVYPFDSPAEFGEAVPPVV